MRDEAREEYFILRNLIQIFLDGKNLIHLADGLRYLQTKTKCGNGARCITLFLTTIGACFSYSECFLDRNATQSATLMRWFVVFLSPMLWRIHVAQLVVYHAPNRKRGGNVARQMVWEYSLASCSDRARVSVGFADNAVRLPTENSSCVFFSSVVHRGGTRSWVYRLCYETRTLIEKLLTGPFSILFVKSMLFL